LKKVISDYLAGKAFLPELFLAHDNHEVSEGAPIVVMGVVQGAIHSIGKHVVNAFLEANGFRVIDVGYCVPPIVFANAVKKHGAKVVGVSVPVTTCEKELRETIKLVHEQGAKIVIGGCAITSEWKDLVGADGYALNAQGAVKVFKELVK
jgi:5-methyltetrahydrofolate--homocysteine methyltransferase